MYAFECKLKYLYLFLIILTEKVSADIKNGATADKAVAACSNLNYFEHRRLYFQDGDRSDFCQVEMSLWLDEINEKALEFNILTADFAWGMSVNPEDPNLAGKGAILDITRSTWRKDACSKVARVDANLLNDIQRRELGFLCRGATLNARESETLSVVLEEMQTMYTSANICIPKSNASQPVNGEKQDHDKDIISYLTEVDEVLTKIEMLCEHDTQKCNPIDIFKANMNLNAVKNEKANINLYNGLESQENIQTNDRAAISNAAILLAAKMAATNEVFGGRSDFVCFSGEPDLERLMARSRSEAILKWAWLAWREKVGPPIRPLYEKMVEVKNSAARRTGYSDIGEIWREELEIPNLENLVDDLLQQTSDLYRSLHGVVRYFLRRFFGPEVVSERGPIPAHLLGNMWAQNWETVLDLILPEAKQIDLDTIIRSTNWTTKDMLKRAEDFYTSIGLFPMTEKFWKYSYFGDGDGGRKNKGGDDEKKNIAKCHGTAANMFMPGDFRMIYCAGLSIEDFYVIHHEMGHIEYYMSYDPKLPVIFQDGANSAFQESVGDAIMYAVLTPQHLQRLGLIKDSLVYEYPKNKHQPSSNTNKHNIINKSNIKKRDINKFNINNRNPFIDLNKKFTYNRYENSMEFIKKLINNEKSDDKIYNSRNSVSKNNNHFKIYSNRDLNKERVNFDSEFQELNAKRSNIFKNMDKNDIENDFFTESDEFEDVPDEDVGVGFDTILLLRQALTKLPQIPFGYIIDKYRWDIFSGKILPEDYNKAFWAYVTKYQGIQPPDGADRPEYYFDAAAKFHVPDNTPYVRYFLSSFLQVQMFRGMCQWSMFGQASPPSPDLRVPMPLHRCDIYGSKKAGRKLREMMSKGSSVNWSEALYILTGDRTISSSALHEYFAPLKTILNNLIAKHDIPLGWEMVI